MSIQQISFKLPEYDDFIDAIKDLQLSVSASELHGIMCAYLASGATSKGEAYIRTLMTHNKKKREGQLALFDLYTITQHQISQFDLEFQLLLPDDSGDLLQRAKAFSEWCGGFVEGLALAGVSFDRVNSKDAQNAILHITEFANLDYEDLAIDEDDENSLLEVKDYTRLAVLQIHHDLQPAHFGDDSHISH